MICFSPETRAGVLCSMENQQQGIHYPPCCAPFDECCQRSMSTTKCFLCRNKISTTLKPAPNTLVRSLYWEMLETDKLDTATVLSYCGTVTCVVCVGMAFLRFLELVTPWHPVLGNWRIEVARQQRPRSWRLQLSEGVVHRLTRSSSRALRVQSCFLQGNDNDNDTLREVPHLSNEGLALQARV